MTTLTLMDEATTGTGSAAGTLTVPETSLTAREIIRRRVVQEVEELDEVVEFPGDTEVSFLKLIAPVGG